MKINFVFLTISIVAASLSGYGFYSANSGEEFVWLLTIGSGLSLVIPLIGLLAIKLSEGRTGNIKAVSSIFLVIMLVEQLLFAFFTLHKAPYIIVTGLLLLAYILICYGITKAVK